ncbi:MAG: NUDIX domain-containing protein [Nitrososphaerales archaeon]
MIIKSVATSFLTYRGKILILKRSDKVGSYRGAWAGVSGYVEQGEEPLHTALKEVMEETGLKLDKCALLKRGEPLPAYDKVKDVLWLVHPFLFKAPTDNIRLDWEHETYAWIKPEALKHYSTVPRLADALERFKPPAFKLSKTLSGYLKEIKKDSTHGSSWLAARAARILQAASDSSTYSKVDTYIQFLKFYAKRLAEARPSMLAIENTVAYLLGRIMEGYSKTLDLNALKALLKRAVSKWLKAKDAAFKRCVKHTSDIFEEKCKVITHSYSSTVLEALKQAATKNKGIKVYVSESRPRYEGRTMAKRLAESGCNVTIITDASIGHLIKDANVALVGADTILADGSVINKMGTYLLALSASKAGVPFYVAAETLKIGVRTLFSKPVLEERSPTEVFKNAPNLKARNIYFDVTPADLVTKIICEHGLIEVSKVYEYAVETLRLSYFP